MGRLSMESLSLHQFNSSEMSAVIIEDGAMVLPDGTGEGKGNNIVTDKEFTNFELLEWKIVEGGNSGIFGVSKKERVTKHLIKQGQKSKFWTMSATLIPLTILIFTKRERFMIWFNPHRMLATRREWNHVFISINYNTNKASVKLNDVEIVNFPLSGPEWDALVANSKFKDWKDFAKFKLEKLACKITVMVSAIAHQNPGTLTPYDSIDDWLW